MKYIRTILLFLTVALTAVFWVFRGELMIFEKDPRTPAEKLAGLPAPDSPPLVIAHKGAHLFTKENSLLSVKAAYDKGYDGTELDVMVSADGELILSHDFLTDDGKDVPKLTAAELKKNYRIETLAPALTEFGQKLVFILELKTDKGQSYGSEKKICKMIQSYNLEDSVIVSSFDLFLILNLQKNCSGIHTMLEISENAESIIPLLKGRYNSPFISVSYRHLTDELFQKIQAEKMILSVFTPNMPWELKDFSGKADLIQTDRPGTLKLILQD